MLNCILLPCTCACVMTLKLNLTWDLQVEPLLRISRAPLLFQKLLKMIPKDLFGRHIMCVNIRHQGPWQNLAFKWAQNEKCPWARHWPELLLMLCMTTDMLCEVVKMTWQVLHQCRPFNHGWKNHVLVCTNVMCEWNSSRLSCFQTHKVCFKLHSLGGIMKNRFHWKWRYFICMCSWTIFKFIPRLKSRQVEKSCMERENRLERVKNLSRALVNRTFLIGRHISWIPQAEMHWSKNKVYSPSQVLL